MWLRNASVYAIAPKFKFDFSHLEAQQFQPITDLALASSGWAIVRDQLYHRAGNQVLLRHIVEKKMLPGDAVAQRLAARVAQITQEQGLAPGKKATRELRERVVDEMLPTAFTTRRSTLVWIDADNNRLCVDSTSQVVVDLVLSALSRSFPSLGVQDAKWPSSAMLTEWFNEEPVDFSVDDEITMAWAGEQRKRAAYKRCTTTDTDLLAGLQSGAKIESMAMTFDSRLSFVINDNMQLRRIKPLDILREEAGVEKDVDRFDSDFYLMTKELGSLIEALGVQA